MKGKYDYRGLTSAVLLQATEDHIKLQNPKKRRRAVERLAFATATSMLWDDDYVLSLKSPEGKEIDLIQLCEYASGRENADVEKLRSWLVEQIRTHWKGTKVIKKIPETLCVSGHTYWVVVPEKEEVIQPAPGETTVSLQDVVDQALESNAPAPWNEFDIGIDFKNKVIRVDPSSETFQHSFICMILDIILHHRDISIDEHDRALIAEDFLLLLQTNELGTK